MKIAISARTAGLEAEVDRHFGRAPWFVFYDCEPEKAESVENGRCGGRHGAGVATAQMVVDRGADVVLTGDCGPKARDVLDAAEVKVVADMEGTVAKAVAAFLRGGDPA